MEFSNIFLSMSNFDELQKKFVIKKKLDEKKQKKKINLMQIKLVFTEDYF